MWSSKWALICSVKGCDKEAKTKGYCRNHYANFWRNGTTDKLNGDKRKHPLYTIWWQRKKDKCLCQAWLNFDNFIKDVSPKPEGNFLLIRLRNEPFGPDNFKWQEHLKRKEGESNKDWWARKREARILANPSMESDRNLKRKFNLTREQYKQKLAEQNYVCAICNEPETAISPNTGTIKGLAVDHCHITNKTRSLLCGRCNTTIGKINESIDLLDKMKLYLIKHKEN